MADAPRIPPRALDAAIVAIHDADCPDTRCSGSALGHCYDLAIAALKAAAPHLAAAERERCAQLAEQVDAFYDAPCPDGDPDCVHQDSPFAGLLRKDHR